MEEFDLPAAYEALARAYAVAGRSGEARRYLELGKAEAAKIADDDDRAISRPTSQRSTRDSRNRDGGIAVPSVKTDRRTAERQTGQVESTLTGGLHRARC